MIVVVKLALNFQTGERLFALYKFSVVEVGPCFLDVLDVVVAFGGGHERGAQRLGVQRLPREVSQPGVLFELERPVRTPNPVFRLLLKHAVHEVSRIKGPASRHHFPCDFCLPLQHLVLNFLPGSAIIGSLTHHALVGNDTHSEVINQIIVVLPLHHFWSHIAGGPRSVLCVFRPKDARNAEVCYSEVALAIQNKVLRLYVSVNHIFGMYVFQALNQTGYKELCLLLIEPASAADVVPQVAASEVVHHQVQVVFVLKGVVHVDNEGAVQDREDTAFVHDRLDGPLENDPSLGHFFQSEQLLGLFALHFPDFAEAPLADAFEPREVLLPNGC